MHPARIYGELVPRLADDAVVIGDGGDFVSFAGKYVEPKRPGGWLDPGPYGCLGAGLGAAIAARIARPSSQVVLLLGDGAAGFSLMDVDTLVRHDLPVVMVMGNNSAWGLEKGPMQMLYGYDVAADLAPRTRLRRRGQGARRRRRDRHRPAPDRPRPRPRLRLRRALPRQRDHRRRRGLPAGDLRRVSSVRSRSAGCEPGDHDAVAALLLAAYDDHVKVEYEYVEVLGDVAGRDRDAEVWVVVDADGSCSARSPSARPARRTARSPATTRVSSGCSPSTRVPRAVASAGFSPEPPSTTPAGTASPPSCCRRRATMSAAHRLYESMGFVRVPDRDWSPNRHVDLLVYRLEL